MAFAFAGIVVMFGGAADAGQLVGNLLALGVSVCFAAQLIVLRKFHATVDMLPMVMIAGLWSLLCRPWLLAGPFAATAHDLVVLALMGCVQLGVGCLLATAASRTLSATELGLLALLEPILGPLWVWVLLGEHRAPCARRRRVRAVRGHRQRGDRRMARARAARPRGPLPDRAPMSYDPRVVRTLTRRHA